MIDLHTHSTFSDGTLTPTQLVDLAKKQGLSAIALTDHNTVLGLPEFMAAGEKNGLKPVPGVEFSTEYNGIELHILGLFVEEENYGPVTALLEDFSRRKEDSNRNLVAALAAAGIRVDYEKIRREAEGYVNRAIIGAEMTALGYTASVEEAFQKYLSEKRGYYVPPRRLDAYDAITFIKSQGLVAVLAHPFLNLDGAQLRTFLPRAVECGLDGMEVFYPKYTPEQTAEALKIADEFALLHSGGSDFHGENKPDIALGTGRGQLQIPEHFLTALEQRKNKP